VQPHVPEIDTVVLLDREVDLVTPLLTPLTYGGLIDEFIGIQSGCIKIDPHLAGDEGRRVDDINKNRTFVWRG